MPKQVVKQKELMILVSALLAFVILISLTTFYYRSDKKDETTEEEEPITAEATISSGEQTESSEDQPESEMIGSEVFFTTPTAADILTEIRNADPYAEQPEFSELPPVKVMWSGYYFSDQQPVEIDDEIIIQLDVDESGFGVILVCTIQKADYPEVLALTDAQQLWVAGQITEIETEGTGTVHIAVEYIRFEETPNSTAAPSPQ